MDDNPFRRFLDNFPSSQPKRPVASFRCVPRNKYGWYRVEVFGRSINNAKNTTNVLLHDLQDLCAANNISLRTYYFQEGGELEMPTDPYPVFTFYINNYELAKSLQVIEIPPDSRMQLNVTNKVPKVRVDHNFKKKMQAAMLAQYNPNCQMLDLYAFHKAPQFTEEFCCLGQNNCMSAAIEIMEHSMPELSRLVLDNNGISDLSPFQGIEHRLPEMTYVSLLFNDLTDVNSFRVFQHLPITQLDIYNNPVNTPPNRKELIEMLPELMMLDSERVRTSRVLFWKEQIERMQLNALNSVQDPNQNSLLERMPKWARKYLPDSIKIPEPRSVPQQKRSPKPEPKPVEVKIVESDLLETPTRTPKHVSRCKLVVVLQHGPGLESRMREAEEQSLYKAPKQIPERYSRFDILEDDTLKPEKSDDDETLKYLSVSNLVNDSQLDVTPSFGQDSKAEWLPACAKELNPELVEEQKLLEESDLERTPQRKDFQSLEQKEPELDREKTPEQVAELLTEPNLAVELKHSEESEPKSVQIKPQQLQLDISEDCNVEQIPEPNLELQSIEELLDKLNLEKSSSGEENSQLESNQEKTQIQVTKHLPEAKQDIELKHSVKSKPERQNLPNFKTRLPSPHILKPIPELEEIEEELQESDLEKTPKRENSTKPKSDQEKSPKPTPETSLLIEHSEESGQATEQQVTQLEKTPEKDDEIQEIAAQPEQEELESDQEKTPKNSPQRLPKTKPAIDVEKQHEKLNLEKSPRREELEESDLEKTPTRKDFRKPIKEELESDREKTPKQIPKHLSNPSVVIKLKPRLKPQQLQLDLIEDSKVKWVTEYADEPKLELKNLEDQLAELDFGESPKREDSQNSEMKELKSDQEKTTKHLPKPYMVTVEKLSEEPKSELEKHSEMELIPQTVPKQEPELRDVEEQMKKLSLGKTSIWEFVVKEDISKAVKEKIELDQKSTLKEEPKYLTESETEFEELEMEIAKTQLETTPSFNWTPKLNQKLKKERVQMLEDLLQQYTPGKEFSMPDLEEVANRIPNIFARVPDPNYNAEIETPNLYLGKVPEKEQISDQAQGPYLKLELDKPQWEKELELEQLAKRQKPDDLGEYSFELIDEIRPWHVPVTFKRDPNHCSDIMTDAAYCDLQRFLNEYIKVYDNDNYRTGIEWFYQKSAVITFTTTEEAYAACLYPLLDEHNRNVSRYTRDYRTETRESAATYFAILPMTKHIRPTIIVDVLVMNPNWICFTITGYYRELCSITGDSSRYVYFMRTFVLTPLSDITPVPDFRIYCEVTYTATTTADQLRVGLIPNPNLESDFIRNIAHNLVYRNLCRSMTKYDQVIKLSRATNVKKHFCCDCLIDCHWNSNMALIKLNRMKARQLIPDVAFFSDGTDRAVDRIYY